MVVEVPVSGYDLWQRKFYSWICLSTGWFLLQLSMRWRNTATTQRKGYCVAGRVKGKKSSKATRTFLRQHITGLHGIFFFFQKTWVSALMSHSLLDRHTNYVLSSTY